MSKKENKFRDYDISTQAIHTGTDYDEGTGAVRRPLHIQDLDQAFQAVGL